MELPKEVSTYMAEVGRQGGKAKSQRKTEAVRKNAKKTRPGAKGKKKIRKPKETK